MMTRVPFRKGVWLAVVTSVVIIGLAVSGLVASLGCGGGDEEPGKTIKATFHTYVWVHEVGSEGESVVGQHLWAWAWCYRSQPSNVTSSRVFQFECVSGSDGKCYIPQFTFNVDPPETVRIAYSTTYGDAWAQPTYGEVSYQNLVGVAEQQEPHNQAHVYDVFDLGVDL